MRIVTIFNRWIEVLADLFVAGREMLRAKHALIVSLDHDGFVVRLLEPNKDAIIRSENAEKDAILGVLSRDTSVPDEVARAARRGLVVLEIPPDQIVMRRITVPAQARELLPGIVRNQIERLSPWHAEQAVYGFDAQLIGDDAASLDVRVLITSRAAVEEARNALADAGLEADRVVTRQRDAPEHMVALWSRMADATRESLEGIRRKIALGIGSTVVASLALGLWAVTSAAAIRAESEDAAARLKTLQRGMPGGSPQANAALGQPARAWVAKETSPSAVIVLEALSRSLPDVAHLTELRLEGATLRVIGLADDAPALLPLLEGSGHLTDVHFFAPTTRGPDGKLFRFHIEARVKRRTTIGED